MAIINISPTGYFLSIKISGEYNNVWKSKTNKLLEYRKSRPLHWNQFLVIKSFKLQYENPPVGEIYTPSKNDNKNEKMVKIVREDREND